MKRAFLDPSTRVLKCVGFVLENSPGDIVIEVPDTFSGIPGETQHNGTSWVPYSRPLTPEEQAHVEVLADNVVQYLQTHTPAECAIYVRNSVTDLPTAKTLMEKFAMVLSILSRNL